MNIYFDPQIFMLQKWGGISRYFENLIIGFANNESLGVVPLIYDPLKKEICHFESRSSFRDVYCRNKPDMFIEHFYYSNKSLKDKLDLIDFVHYSYYLRSYQNNKLLSFTKTISTIHDFIPEKNTLKMFAQKFFYNKEYYLTNSNKIIFVSPETKTHALNLGFCNDGAVVPLGSDHLKNFISAGDSKSSKYGSYILYVGKRHGYKNFKDLLFAYEQSKILRNFKLVLFGGEKLNKFEIHFLSRSRLMKNVIHLDGNDEILSDLYSNAFVTVSTSAAEGFSLIPLEVASFGGVLVCSNIDVHKKYINNFALGYEVNNSYSLMSKLESIVNSKILYRSLSKKSFIFGNKYTWDYVCDRTSSFYHK